jgi:acyl-CoA thioesterase-1
MKNIFIKTVTLFGISAIMLNNTINSAFSENLNTKVITTYGDSLTAGYGLNAEDSYPSVLQKKLEKEGYNYKVVNSGQSGDTTSAALNRIGWVIKTKPEIVILELGGNDALRGMPPENAKKNLETIIEKLQSNKIKILLAGMKAPKNLGEKYTTTFDNMYPELAKKYKLPLIPFFLAGVALDKKLNIEDGIHPNKKGYLKIVDNNIWKYLKPILVKK